MHEQAHVEHGGPLVNGRRIQHAQRRPPLGQRLLAPPGQQMREQRRPHPEMVAGRVAGDGVESDVSHVGAGDRGQDPGRALGADL